MRRALIVLMLAGLMASGAFMSGRAYQAGTWSLEVTHLSAVMHVAAVPRTTSFTHFQVNCGTTATTALTAAARRKVILQNVGTAPIYIGGGHATVTAANGITLHAVISATDAPTTSRLVLEDYGGTVTCLGADVGQTLQVMEFR